VATPVGHALAGYAVYNFSPSSRCHQRRGLMLWCIVMAVLPDLDFLPGILAGTPALYHQGISHSLGVAFLVSFALAGILGETKSFSQKFTLLFLSYCSHLLIDFFGPDRRLPYGIPMFWPISGKHFISPLPLFWGAQHASSTTASPLQWIEGLFTLHNLGAIAFEVLIIAPFIFLGARFRKDN
jgi:inner membrane protein